MKEERKMQKGLRIAFIILVLVLPIAGQAHGANRFADNGDGTVTDTRRGIMWQRSDNGTRVSFEAAREYCKSLRLGGHADWRLPEPAELDTATAMELSMSRHSPDVYSRFDLYWSNDSVVLLPFNYQPAQGRQVERAYPARGDDRAFVRAVRAVKGARTGSGG